MARCACACLASPHPLVGAAAHRLRQRLIAVFAGSSQRPRPHRLLDTLPDALMRELLVAIELALRALPRPHRQGLVVGARRSLAGGAGRRVSGRRRGHHRRERPVGMAARPRPRACARLELIPLDRPSQRRRRRRRAEGEACSHLAIFEGAWDEGQRAGGRGAELGKLRVRGRAHRTRR